MKTLLIWCLTLLAVGLPLYLLYWNLFRAILMQRLKYRLFRERDELRLLLISGEINSNEKAFPLVESFCNRALMRLEHVDLVNLLSSKRDKQMDLEVERDWQIIFAAGPDVRRCFFHIVFVSLGAAAANSPGILVLLSPFVVFSVTALWFNKVRRWLIELLKKAMGNFFVRPAAC